MFVFWLILQIFVGAPLHAGFGVPNLDPFGSSYPNGENDIFNSDHFSTRGSWIEADITTDLKITITGLINKKEYLMRVKAVNAIGESDPLPLPKSFIAKNESDVPDPPGKPFAYDWDR